MPLTVEVAGLEILGRHGVGESERGIERPFLFDLWLDVPETVLSDRIEDAVDYRLVAARVREISDGRSFHLLEALADAVADAIAREFAVERVRVRVRKPTVRPAGLVVDHTAAIATRERS